MFHRTDLDDAALSQSERNQRDHRPHRRLPGAATGLAWLCLASLASASTVDAKKEVTWSLRKAPTAEATGSYEYDVQAVASDCHLKDSDHVKGDKSWILVNGLLPVTRTTGKQGGAPHPEAEAFLTFDAGLPYKPEGDDWQIDSSIRSFASAEKPVADGTHQKASSHASARGRVVIGSARVDGASLKIGDRKVKVKPSASFVKGIIGIGGGVRKNGTRWFRDPVHVSVLEEETGTIWEEELLRIVFESTGYGELTVDDTSGIVMEAPMDGLSSVRIDSDAVSSWVTNSSGAMSASLRDGEFVTGGALAGLPWILTESGGDVIRAELPAGFVPEFEADYEVPDVLLTDSYNYAETLVYSVDTQSSSTEWVMLDGALPGSLGEPLLVASGDPVVGAPGDLELSSAAPGAPAFLFASLGSEPIPFRGGMLVAFPFVALIGPFGVSGTGDLMASHPAWPALPPGTEVVFQWVIQDPAGPFGVALSNGIATTQP